MEFKGFFMWLLIFIIGSLIVSFLISPNTFQSFKSNIKDITKSESNLQGKVVQNLESKEQKVVEDSLINRCEIEFYNCANILEKKYGSSTEIIEYKKFYDPEKALEFHKTWNALWGGTVLTHELGTENLEEEMPIVLFASSITNTYGDKSPLVFVCSKKGKIVGIGKNFC